VAARRFIGNLSTGAHPRSHRFQWKSRWLRHQQAWRRRSRPEYPVDGESPENRGVFERRDHAGGARRKASVIQNCPKRGQPRARQPGPIGDGIARQFPIDSSPAATPTSNKFQNTVERIVLPAPTLSPSTRKASNRLQPRGRERRCERQRTLLHGCRITSTPLRPTPIATQRRPSRARRAAEPTAQSS